ncbi:hypothetical protein SHK09_11915 [Polaribacter sp. PL03]|uniref:hypothetical protein n=1 Tax=Polaribacter sp. PL03 TaxID=3088353 RepID=UPI0029CD2E4D|nr:hypothetical protein [Polaribacter sp. PL03]MDX6747503.1 hypothetical protein [Polaribacter sp. PL03]
MKKIISIFVLVLAVTFSAQAQKKGKKGSPEKQVERTLKKLSADLELTKVQQNEIKPLLALQIADRKEMAAKRKALKDTDKKPSKEERKMMREGRVAKEAEMNKKMKSILTEKQFVIFEKMNKERKGKNRKKQQ